MISEAAQVFKLIFSHATWNQNYTVKFLWFFTSNPLFQWVQVKKEKKRNVLISKYSYLAHFTEITYSTTDSYYRNQD